MKIHIDQDGCIECGSCEAACPDVFVLPDGEKARIVEKYRIDSTANGQVGPELESCAQEAADSCPVTVISVE